MIFSAIILKFDLVKNIIIDYNIEILEKAAYIAGLIINKNQSKINIEKIIDIFCEEYTKILLEQSLLNSVNIKIMKSEEKVKKAKKDVKEKENNIKNCVSYRLSYLPPFDILHPFKSFDNIDIDILNLFKRLE